MHININDVFGTAEGRLLQKESETFEAYCKKNVGSQSNEIDRLRQTIDNERVTVVSQFQPEDGQADQLMTELKNSSMGSPILVVVDPFSSPIEGQNQVDFYRTHGFEEIEFSSGEGQVMVLK